MQPQTSASAAASAKTALSRYDVLGDFAKLAAEGRFKVPVARTFTLGEWREAFDVSNSGRAHGKLVLQTARTVNSR